MAFDGSDLRKDLPPGFYRDRGGIYAGAPEEQTAGLWICGPLYITAQTHDQDGEAWGLMLKWSDSSGRPHQWAMPKALLHEKPQMVAGMLADGGLIVSPGRKEQEALKRMLARDQPPDHIVCVRRTGWHRLGETDVFVLPNGDVIGTMPPDGGVHFQHRATLRHGGQDRAGTLQDWQENVARFAIGNDRLGFAIAAGFVSTLMDMVSLPGGGVNYVGPSQIGKTTILRGLASCWGHGERFIRSWRATANGLEAAACERHNLPLPLDELGLASAKEVGEAVYSLSNGKGKSRATQTGGAAAAQEWSLFLVSSGEKTLADKMAEAGQSITAGLEVRLATIPADAGKGFGIYNTLHGLPSGAALSRRISSATETHYGTAGPAFLERLAADRSDRAGLVRRICAMLERFRVNMPAGADGQVDSVLQRFALVACAGELAIGYGVLPWPKGEAFRAASTCFRAWLSARGHVGAEEDKKALDLLKLLIQRDGASRFATILPDGQGMEPIESRPITNRAGFRRKGQNGWEYLIMSAVWKTELSREGLNPGAAARAVRDAGFLDPDPDGRHLARKDRIPGEPPSARYYVIHGL